MSAVIDLVSEEEEEEDEDSEDDSIITNFIETLFLSSHLDDRITTTTLKKRGSSVVPKLHFDDGTLRCARELVTSVSMERGGQSDVKGVGIVAKRDLKVGESFLDEYAKYQHGKVPSNWENDERGNYIKSKDGYFILRPSYTEWMNEARCTTHTNYSNIKCQHCKALKNVDIRISFRHNQPILSWKITQPIPKGTELLTFYGPSDK